MHSDKSVTSKTWQKILLIVIIIIGFISSFVGGYFLKDLLKIETNTPETGLKATPIPSNKPVNIDGIPQETTKFLPGKYYFDDTVIAISKSEPYISLVATATRQEGNLGYVQSSRVSFFDGKDWSRKIDSRNTPNSTIVTDSLIRKWVRDIDDSRVLKESTKGEVKINDTSVSFSTGPLQNEISMRSLPGYTKFMSKGEGKINVDGVNYPSYILYTRIYSLNSSDIQFYDTPLNLITDWLIFWDKEANLYHIDQTEVGNPTDIYKTHKVAVFENINNSVTKTFQLSIKRDSTTPPSSYAIDLGSPINSILNLNLIDSINKAPDNSYKWFMGHVKGVVKKSDGKSVEGVGLVEYIHN